MNILPKNPSEFLDKQYWDRFFNKLKGNHQEEFFEWYGSYADHRELLDRLIAEKNAVLNIGCGKSLIAEDMLQSGKVLDVVSCDYSEQVVADMQERAYARKLPLKYEVADVFELSKSYKQGQFDVVLDKGTLDAVFPEETAEIITRLKEKFLPGVLDVLAQRSGSKYIIVSLLQQHILKLLLNFFANQPNWAVHCYESRIKDSKMQPFVVSCEFCESKSESPITMHYLNGKAVPVTPSECELAVLRLQAQTQMSTKITRLSPGQHFSLEILSEERQPRFALEVMDTAVNKILERNSCMVFVVPQGKERTFLYNTERGLKMLHDQIPCSRLIVVKLLSGNLFGAFEAVKQELNPSIKELLPKGCKPSEVPYATDGDELGERSYLYKDKDYIVEEVRIEENYYRRLVIASNIGLVQSQFRLTYYNESRPEKQYLREQNERFGKGLLPPSKKGAYIGIDDEYLEEDGYEQAAITGLSLLRSQATIEKARVLVLGGGACVIPRYLYNHFPGVSITTVEIDRGVIQLAERFFELQQDARFQVVECDALKFIFQAAQKAELYDVIIFDINGGKDGEPSPSNIFVSKDFLSRVQKCLSPEGILIFHMINREPPQAFQDLFNPVYIYTEEIVTLLYCRNQPIERRQDANKKEVVVTKLEDQEIPKQGRFGFEMEVLSKIKVHWPKVGGMFNGAEVYVENEEGQLVNNMKNAYKNDLEKVNRKKNKKKR